VARRPPRGTTAPVDHPHAVAAPRHHRCSRRCRSPCRRVTGLYRRTKIPSTFATISMAPGSCAAVESSLATQAACRSAHRAARQRAACGIRFLNTGWWPRQAARTIRSARARQARGDDDNEALHANANGAPKHVNGARRPAASGGAVSVVVPAATRRGAGGCGGV